MSWAVIGIALTVIIIGVDRERYRVSTGALIISSIVLLYLTGHSISQAYHFVIENPTSIFYGLLIYAVAGIVWGLVKWFFFLLKVRDMLVAWREKHKVTDQMTHQQTMEFLRWNSLDVGSIPPSAVQNKARITQWMIWWPFSMAWTVVNEPVTRFFTFVYRRLSNLLQSVSDRLFRGLV